MNIVGRSKLCEFSQKHQDAKKWIDAWVHEAEHDNWMTPENIKAKYRSASFLKDNVVIFNVKGNHYRMVCKVAYKTKIILISWIGTHAEYSKLNF